MTTCIGRDLPNGKVEWVGGCWFVLSVWSVFVCSLLRAAKDWDYFVFGAPEKRIVFDGF